ncbi:MAG: glycosyltransferase family 87 protein [Candidatus Promineifilaceae bacterium]
MAQTRQTRIEFLIIAGLFLLALFSLGRMVSKMIDPAFGGLDLHSIWHSGHALRQGEDPLRFALDKRSPDLPVAYLDGTVTSELPIAQPGLPTLPSNTAPIYLPLAATAYLSWPVARWVGFALNFGLMLLIPALLIRLFPYRHTLSTADKLLIFLLVLTLTGTRVTVWIGQTTFMVFALMLGSLLLRERHPVWSGILLGFALSKYSLAIAAVLFLLWEWRRRNGWILITAAAVQATGLLILAWLGRTSPQAIMVDYIDIFKIFIDTPQGLRLGMLFPDSPFFAIAVPLLLTIAVFGLLAWLRMNRPWQNLSWELAGFETFSALVFWSLLVAYHRIYDYSTAIVAAPLGLLLFHSPGIWRLSQNRRTIVLALISAGFAVLAMPGTIVEVVLPADLAQTWLWLFDRLLILAIFVMLGSVLWLLSCPHTEEVEKAVSAQALELPAAGD